MATSVFKLAMHIGATVSGSLSSSVRGSRTQLNLLGSALDNLQGKQRAISRFQLAEANVGGARVEYQRAARDVTRLRREIAQTDAPTASLTREFNRAQERANRLSQRLQTQRERLQRARQSLDQAGLSANDLTRDNTRLGASVTRLTAQYQRLGQAIRAQQQNANRRSELRGQLFDAAAIGATVATPLNVAIDFEQSIATLGAISRTEGQVLQGLSDEAERLGASTSFSATESASAMKFLAMSGFNAGQILQATAGVLDLAQAAGTDLGQSADIASNILSGFALEASEMNRVGNVLVGTFTTSNTTLESLGETMKFVAPVASSVGASIEEVAAISALLGDVGLHGSLAGTALRSAFLRLAAPPRMAADALAELGVETKNANGDLRSMPEILEEVAQATQNLGTGEQAEIISKIFGKEASAAMIELIKQVQTFDEANDGTNNNLEQKIQDLVNQQVTAQAVAQKMNDTTAGALKTLGSALESVAISVGSVLLPTIASLAKGFATVARGVSSFAQAFPTLTKWVVGITVGLATLKVVTIAGAFAFTFLHGGVLSLVTAYRTLSAAFTLAQLGFIRFNTIATLAALKTKIITAAQWAWNLALSANPISLIVIGIGSLITAGVLLVSHWDTVSNFFSSIWESIKENTVEAVTWLIDKISLLMLPFELLGQVASFVFGSDENNELQDKIAKTNNAVKTAALGTAITTTTALVAPLSTTELPDNLSPASIQNTQAVRIDAPITINTTPNMDAVAVGNEVQRVLDERQARAEAERRGNLFDGVE
ncbi:phage tail tape measure protein [Agarilytica rhodophyticola]|uniref:phage tail tape measure protein n=1 Tax=Agarilytica rhodophyticola TaxID=1737490 RepID=UPI000B342E16|nr:phage tail tape measure protein [Agarilytica rhodophyticola]